MLLILKLIFRQQIDICLWHISQQCIDISLCWFLSLNWYITRYVYLLPYSAQAHQVLRFPQKLNFESPQHTETSLIISTFKRTTTDHQNISLILRRSCTAAKGVGIVHLEAPGYTQRRLWFCTQCHFHLGTILHVSSSSSVFWYERLANPVLIRALLHNNIKKIVGYTYSSIPNIQRLWKLWNGWMITYHIGLWVRLHISLFSLDNTF